MTSKMMNFTQARNVYEIPFEIIQLRKDIKQLCEEVKNKRTRLKNLEEKLK